MSEKKNIFKRIIIWIERYLPMSFSSFVLFAFIIYLFIIVGRSIWSNYNSNKQLDVQEEELLAMQDEVEAMKYRISYYQTASFKEKEAREKLGYKAPGERVIALPVDEEQDKVTDQAIREVEIRTPNYLLWWRYFFE